MVFQSIAEIQQYIISHSQTAVVAAQEKVFQIMEDVLLQFYSDPTTGLYDRTYQLLTCCVKTGVVSTGNGWQAEVYFDIGQLSYLAHDGHDAPTGQQVWDAASQGMHGAIGSYVNKKGEKKNFYATSGGTPISQESLNRITSEIYPLLKAELIAAGIPVV